MRTSTLRERLRYRFDDFMSRGTLALILGLFVLSALMIVAIALVVTVADQLRGANGSDLNFIDAVWLSLLRTLDSGTMGGDTGSVAFVLAMLVVTLGGLFIVATLIGVIASGIEGKLDELRKGRSRVIEDGHTVILGWNTSIFTVLAELVEANANRRRATVVVLADRDKVAMEDEIRARIPDLQGTRIVCRSGSPIDLDEIDIASVQTSRSIIVLAPSSDEPDADVIKTLLAITNDPNRRPEPYHVVAELHEPTNLDVARMVGRQEVELVLVGDLIARITAQACRQPGLSIVYTEVLDFGGDEIYLSHQPGLAGRTFGDALLVFEDSALIGLLPAGGTPKLNPPMDTPIGPDDQVIAISADDDTVRVAIQPAVPDTAAITEGCPRPTVPERTLVLGWNRLAPTIIRELDHYLEAGSQITVLTHLQEAGVALHRMTEAGARATLEFQPGDTTSRTTLDALDVPSFDHVVLLGSAEGMDPQRADARTLVSLLHLRDIAARSDRRFSIVSEMLDVRNRDLAAVTRADDFIVSDRLVSLYLTQIAEDKRLAGVFADLFDADGSEIYLKPATGYVQGGRSVSFATVVESARRQGEVAIGYRSNEGIRVNPRKSSVRSWTDDDRVIVIAQG